MSVPVTVGFDSLSQDSFGLIATTPADQTVINPIAIVTGWLSGQWNVCAYDNGDNPGREPDWIFRMPSLPAVGTYMDFQCSVNGGIARIYGDETSQGVITRRFQEAWGMASMLVSFAIVPPVTTGYVEFSFFYWYAPASVTLIANTTGINISATMLIEGISLSGSYIWSTYSPTATASWTACPTSLTSWSEYL